MVGHEMDGNDRSFGAEWVPLQAPPLEPLLAFAWFMSTISTLNIILVLEKWSKNKMNAILNFG